MLAGIGVAHASGAAALAAAAERFAIPVATTLGAKGILPEDHPLSLGVFGYGGSRWATEALLDPAVDVLIVLGSALSQRDTLQWDRKMLPSCELIQIDADPSLIGRTWPASVPVTGSPRLFLEHLAKVDGPIAAGLQSGMATRRAFLAGIRDRGARQYDEQNVTSDDQPMHPARMISVARAACPTETVLAVDSGAHRAWCSQYWLSHGDGDYLSLANLGPMGGSIALGIGAKLARPDRPLVVATGDGCMLMHGLELHTAARHHVPIVFLVFDNQSYGNIWYRAAQLGCGPERLTDITGIDWAAFARSMGGDGLAVSNPDELPAAFDRALAFPGPFVIAARIDKRYPTPVAPWREAVAEWEDNH
jgi:acetolactate synthase-1/2/3 large subunit